MTTPNKLFWVRDQESAVAVLASTKEAALAAGARELDYNESEESAAEQGLEALDENDMGEEPIGFLAFWHEFVQREIAKAVAVEREASTRALVELKAKLEDDIHRPGKGPEAFYVGVGSATGMQLAIDAIRSRSNGGAADASGVVDERAACAAEVEGIADQVQKEIDTTFPTGEALSELVAARTVLAKATAAIRARSKRCSEDREALATAKSAAWSWSWSSPLGCFIASDQVVELRAYPDGRWWVWESGQSKADGRAGNVHEAMLCAVTRERQDTRNRSDCLPALDEWLARLEAELVRALQGQMHCNQGPKQ